MDEATLQEIKASLSLQGETQMPSEAMITEDMKFKMYKVKEGHLLELTLTLEDMLNAVEELPTGFEKTGVNELILGVTFDDVIKKIDLTFELNFTYDMGDEIPDFNLKYDISAKGEFHISTKGKAPTMPDMDVLNSFPEMDDSSLLPFFN